MAGSSLIQTFFQESLAAGGIKIGLWVKPTLDLLSDLRETQKSSPLMEGFPIRICDITANHLINIYNLEKIEGIKIITVPTSLYNRDSIISKIKNIEWYMR